MDKSLRNDVRIWLPIAAGGDRQAGAIPVAQRDCFIGCLCLHYADMVPRDVASRRVQKLWQAG